MDCYVYCFCADPAPDIQGTSGIQGSRIQCIQCDGIVAITTESAGCPDPTARNIIAHNRVVNSILKVGTPVPCRFGTVLSCRDLEAYAQAHGSAVKSLLQKFQGCVEMTLRITRNGQDAGQDTAQNAASNLEDEIQARSTRLLPESRGPGTRFLEDKLRQAVREEIANRQAQAILDWAQRKFEAVAKDSVARLRPEASLVADIAHLVERARLANYHDSFRSAAKERADLRLSLSGPWAPYSFAAFDDPRPVKRSSGR